MSYKTYLIKRLKDDEIFFKIGFTKFDDEKARHNFGETKINESKLSFNEKFKMISDGYKYVPDSDYSWEYIHTEEFDYEGQAKLLEKKVLQKFIGIKYFPKEYISGSSECFIFSQDNIKIIKAFMIKYAGIIRKITPPKLHYKILKSKVRKDDPIEEFKEIVYKWKAKQNAPAGR